MDKKFVIICRYETFTSEGKKFTKWFVKDSNPRSKEECEKIISKLKEDFEFIDKKTKLKHEYGLKDYDEYVRETNELKLKVENLHKKNEAYYKSAEYKELQKKKRISAKERKERQKKYLEENGCL